MRMFRCLSIGLLVSLLTCSVYATELHDYQFVHGFAYDLAVDFDFAIAIDTAEAVSMPTAPDAIVYSSSVRAFNTARPVDRVARWRGLLRE